MPQSQTNKGGRCCSGFLKNIRLGLFGSLFVLSKKVTSVFWIELVFLFVRLCQLMSFPLTDPATSANFKGTIKPVQLLTSFLSPVKLMDFVSPRVFVALLFVAVAWTCTLLLLITWTAISFLRDSFVVLWPLKVLRLMGLLSVSILFQPLFGMLLSPFRCRDPDATFLVDSGYDCSGTSIMLMQIAGTILALLLLAFASIFVVSFYESSMLSRQVVAKAHGRLDLMFLLVSVVLVVGTETFGTLVSAWLQTACMIACAVVYLLAVLLWLPHYMHFWNSLQAGVAMTFLFTCLAIIINLTYPDGDAALVIYCGSPLAFGVGVLLANWRASMLFKLPSARIGSPYEVELKARYIFHEALWGHPTDRVKFGACADQVEAEKALAARKNGVTDTLLKTSTAATGSPAASHTNSATSGSTTDLQILEDAEGEDESEKVAVLKRLIPPSVFEEMAELYKASAARMPQSAVLQLFASRFYGLLGNRRLALSHLAQAEKKHPPLDVSFVAFQQKKISGDGSSSSQNGAGGMSALNRVAFESLTSDVKRHVLKAALKQTQFWAELTSDRPDLSRLHDLSSAMNEAIGSAEKAFAELFVIDPHSINAMRLYGAFCINVLADNDKGNALLAESERLEDAKSKDHRSEKASGIQVLAESNLDVFADSTAIVTVGGTARNLGLVVTTNMPCARLFGYSRIQLERRDFTTLLPPPFAEEVGAALRNYVNTGESWVLGSTRILLGLHRAGQTFPILMSIRESPPDDGAPTFIVLMRELRSAEQQIVMTTDCYVTAASATALTLLGVDAAALQSLEFNLKDAILELEATLPQLLAGATVPLRIDPPSLAQQQNFMSETAIVNVARPHSSFKKSGSGKFGASSPQVRNSRNTDPGVWRDSRATGLDDVVSVSSDDSGKPQGSVDSDSEEEEKAKAPAGRQQLKTTSQRTRSMNDLPPILEPSWIRAQLQRVVLPTTNKTCFVLGFQRIPASDLFAIQKAEVRRAELLAAAGAVTQWRQPGAPTAMQSSFYSTASAQARGNPMLMPSNNFSGNNLNASAFSPLHNPMLVVSPHSTPLGGPRRSVDSHMRVAAPTPAGGDSPYAGFLPGTVKSRSDLPKKARGEKGKAWAGDADSVVSGASGLDAVPAQRDVIGLKDSNSRSPKAAKADSSATAGAARSRRAPIKAVDDTTGGENADPLADLLSGPSARPSSALSSSAAAAPKPVMLASSESNPTLPPATTIAMAPTPVQPAGLLSPLGAASVRFAGTTLDEQPLMPASLTIQRPEVVVDEAATGLVSTPIKSSLKSAANAVVIAVASQPRRPSTASDAPMTIYSPTMPTTPHGAVMPTSSVKAPGSVSSAMKKGQGDGRSEASKSKASSQGTTTVRSLAKLRRALADRDQRLLPGLFWLRAVGVLTTLLSIGLGIAIAIITVNAFLGYGGAVEHMQQGHQRIINVALGMNSAMGLIEAGKGLRVYPADEVAELRRGILSNMSVFSSHHKEMFTFAKRYGFDSIYTQPYITVTAFDEGFDSGVSSVTNLFTAGMYYPTTLGRIATTSFLQNLSNPHHPDVRFMVRNLLPLGNPAEEIEASSGTAFFVSLQSAKDLQAMLISTFSSMTALLLVIAFCIFLPILRNVERSKDTIVVRFIELPPVARRVLYLQSLRRTRTLRQTYVADDEDGDDYDDADDSEEEALMTADLGVAGVTDASGGARILGLRDAGQDDDDESGGYNWQAILAGASVTPGPGSSSSASASGAKRSRSSGSRKKGKPIKPYRKSSKSFLLLILRFIGPMVALFIFFAVLFGFSMLELDRVVQVSSALAASNSRSSNIREVRLDARRMVNEYGPPEFLQREYLVLEEVVKSALFQSRLLQYGLQDGDEDISKEYLHAKTTPQLETGDSRYLPKATAQLVYDALFGETACQFLAQTLPPPFMNPYTQEPRITKEQFIERCEDFEGGLLKKGLQSGMQELFKRGLRVADLRLRAKLGPRSLKGEGWLLPVSIYNSTSLNRTTEPRPLPSLTKRDVLPPPHIVDLNTYFGDFRVGPDGVTPLEADLNITELIPVGLTTYSEEHELVSPDMKFLLQAASMYVAPGMEAIGHLYADALDASILGVVDFLEIFSGVYLALFACYIIFVFVPQTSRSNNDIISKRNILLYLPVEIASHPPIRKLIREYLASEHDRGNSGGGGPHFEVAGMGGGAARRGPAKEGGGGDRTTAATLERTRSFHS